jgi:hypothetical protein
MFVIIRRVGNDDDNDDVVYDDNTWHILRTHRTAAVAFLAANPPSLRFLPDKLSLEALRP